MRTPPPLAVLALGIVSAAACAKQEAAGLTLALGTNLPGMAAVSKAGPDGTVAYGATAGRPAGYVVHRNGFDARKLVAESGPLTFSGGAFANAASGLYQACLP